eukprot:1150773-Pelagomonas_calceolata.AAC.2
MPPGDPKPPAPICAPCLVAGGHIPNLCSLSPQASGCIAPIEQSIVGIAQALHLRTQVQGVQQVQRLGSTSITQHDTLLHLLLLQLPLLPLTLYSQLHFSIHSVCMCAVDQRSPALGPLLQQGQEHTHKGRAWPCA